MCSSDLVAPYAISLVLIRVDCGVQQPIYYVSKSLHKVEMRYLPLEKAIMAVVLGTWKLPHYFQAHTIVVLTQLPLKAILRSADYTALQQNVFLATNFSEKIFFVTENLHLATKFIIRH